MFSAENALKKWAPILEHADAPAIKDNYRKAVTAILLENQEKALREDAATLSGGNFLTEGTNAASSSNYDPVLIGLVRRAMPQLIAYDICGVQPMTGPTGLIFAMKSRTESTVGAVVPSPALTPASTEALFDTVQNIGGAGAFVSGTPGVGLSTAAGEVVNPLNMGFTIEKGTVTAVTRALKADYSMELAQDLKAIHGLDAESELANILSQEILVEINREVIESIRTAAVQAGSPAGASTFDLTTDADGRWAVEKFMSLLFKIEQEANAIAAGTRRGKGNFIVCHADVASALAATGRLNSSGIGEGLDVDITQNTYAGKIGNIKVYVDPYATAAAGTTLGAGAQVIVGYRGTSQYDAGYFYAPYVPLTMVRTIDPLNFQPKIAFKTRYGTLGNPLAAAGAGLNPYFRKFGVSGINTIAGATP